MPFFMSRLQCYGPGFSIYGSFFNILWPRLEPVQIHIPFPGQHLLFFGVTVFAAGHQIEFFRPTAPDQGDEVIHGQFCRQKPLTAVMADPFVALAFPPLGMPQLSGFGPLFFQKQLIHETIRFHRFPQYPNSLRIR
jgi:hypothetical protein